MKKITFNFIRPMGRNESRCRKPRLSPFALVVSALMLIMNVACNKEPAIVEAASVQLNKTSVTIHVGETADLTATVTPDNATNKTVSWMSSNASIATVSNGRITAMSIGSTTITARCGNVQATCTVTVSPIEVTSIQLNKTSVTLHAGETAELTATVAPDNAPDKTVTWSSSNTSIATVANGKVTALMIGTATITAQCGNVKAECEVTVSPIEVTSIQLNKTSVTLYVGETASLTATVAPDNATDKTVTWTSSNTEVATVSNGKITAVAVGSATITAKCGNVQATCTITVSPIAVTSIQLNKTYVTLHVGKTIELKATILPENATDKSVTWSSSNTEIAAVENGKVTAVAVGSATITAKSNNDISVTCRIVVVEKDVVPPGGSEGTEEEEWK